MDSEQKSLVTLVVLKNISVLQISLKYIVILMLSTCNFVSSFVTSIVIGQCISESLPGIMTSYNAHLLKTKVPHKSRLRSANCNKNIQEIGWTMVLSVCPLKKLCRLKTPLYLVYSFPVFTLILQKQKSINDSVFYTLKVLYSPFTFLLFICPTTHCNLPHNNIIKFNYFQRLEKCI